jgi:hypothetical protein
MVLRDRLDSLEGVSAVVDNRAARTAACRGESRLQADAHGTR